MGLPIPDKEFNAFSIIHSVCHHSMTRWIGINYENYEKLITIYSLRAGSLGEREPARIPMMIACRPSAQTGNTHQYCKHKSINVELHIYCILSLVSYTDRHWGILKKLKRLEVLQCNISSCTFSYYNLHVFLWAQ
jgi:hypothetical protein